jgi:DNA/RNA endonuclease G (NUC1)
MRILIIAVIWLTATLGQALAKEPRVLEPRDEDGDVGIRNCDNDNNQRNNPDLAGPYEIKICYDAFVVNFPERPQAAEPWRVPRFVVHRVHRRDPAQATDTAKRPKWRTVPELAKEGLAATNDSYRFDPTFRKSEGDWYERGHLAPKMLAGRVSAQAAYFSHTTANAVPQRPELNKNAWFELECRTGVWTKDTQDLWVITGPVFDQQKPSKWLRSPDQTSAEKDERGRNARPPIVAIPERLFKVVVRHDGYQYQALAFLFTQAGKDYTAKARLPAERALVTIAEIEALTNIVFFENLGAKAPDKKLAGRPGMPGRLWPQKAEDFIGGCSRFAKDES